MPVFYEISTFLMVFLLLKFRCYPHKCIDRPYFCPKSKWFWSKWTYVGLFFYFAVKMQVYLISTEVYSLGQIAKIHLHHPNTVILLNFPYNCGFFEFVIMPKNSLLIIAYRRVVLYQSTGVSLDHCCCV